MRLFLFGRNERGKASRRQRFVLNLYFIFDFKFSLRTAAVLVASCTVVIVDSTATNRSEQVISTADAVTPMASLSISKEGGAL